MAKATAAPTRRSAVPCIARLHSEASMFLGLGTVIYHVSDLAAAMTWYAAAFGVTPYFDEPFYVGFEIGGFELGLDPDMSGVAPGNNAVAYWGRGRYRRGLEASACP